MTSKTIATLLILLAGATAGANLASMAGAPMGAASTDEDFTGEDYTEQASLDTGSWTAPDTGTTMDILTGTESLPVTIRALSSASV
jgi:hypothetical protein